MRSFLEYMRRHPFTTAAVAGLAALVAAVGAVETVWSIVSDDPLLPFVGDRVRAWGDDAARVLSVIALFGLVAVMLRIQLAIYRETREPDVLFIPEDVTKLPGVLRAGSDFAVTLQIPSGHGQIRNPTFDARQGRRTIVRNKPGRVEGSNPQTLVLPYTAKETSQLRDGILIIAVYYEDENGVRAVLPWATVETQGPLLRG